MVEFFIWGIVGIVTMLSKEKKVSKFEFLLMWLALMLNIITKMSR